jgi:hypothetical protein
MNPFLQNGKGDFKYHQSRVFYLQIFICKVWSKYSSDQNKCSGNIVQPKYNVENYFMENLKILVSVWLVWQLMNIILYL